jgi:Damage-control phosphatase ARMT1-like domain
MSRPQLPIPPDLIVSEPGSFAYFTFTHRFPVIIDRILAENSGSPDQIDRLKQVMHDVLYGIISPIAPDGGPDIADWQQYIRPYAGKRWLDTPFYFAETYFYRRILAATGYFTSGDTQGLDPFDLQKRLSLSTVMDAVRPGCLQLQSFHQFSATTLLENRGKLWQQASIDLLYLDLWGNRADLSLNPGVAGEFDAQFKLQTPSDRVLIDDTKYIAEALSDRHQICIDIIVDNAGLELICDLFLADFLLATQVAKTVTLHVKSHPTFVSDVMAKDIPIALDILAGDREPAVQEFARRIRNYLKSDRLHVRDHFFWTSPLFFWQMPESLRQDLDRADFVFVKGDANYRRLIGDCHWDKTSSFDKIASYFHPSFAILRTLKSELIVGLQPQQIDRADREDSQWLTNGSWGIVQLANSRS